MFNGKDLSNWTIKIRGFPLGENAFNTFRVSDGILQARYDEYTEFKERFGHIFYNGGPFSHYKIQVEYRFVGEQVKGGPAWALRNNGIMYHTQDPKTMAVEQDFPGSMEYQLLGGNGKDARTTGNLCTPGTHVVFNGKFTEDHIINSSSDTFHGDQWVTAELIVHGSEKAEHFINGKKVLEYTGLQWDDRTPNGSGFIALQAESHPTDFRKVRLLNLEGCMDKKAKNYKSYFVKDNHKACQY
ncbi:3-keto-disaccharide hydrolase [Cellvibrio sp.]